MKRKKIIIVDDNTIFRESLKELLVKRYHYDIIGEASSGTEFLDLPRNSSPDVILVDLSMPNLNGFEATKKYFWKFPNSKIIAVTASIEIAFLDKLIETGFKGCVFKHNVFNEIQMAIETVSSGGLWYRDIDNLSDGKKLA